MVKKILSAFAKSAALVCLLLLFGGADYLGNKQFEKSQNLMGTVFDITVFESGLEKDQLSGVLDEAFRIVAEIGTKISDTDPNGLEYKVAQAKAGDAILLDSDQFLILKDAFEVTRLSEGNFDITDAPFKAAWRDAKQKGELPDPAKIAQILPNVSIKRLTLDTQNEKLVVSESGTQIELDGLARAYAMDKAVKFLKEKGIKSAAVSNGESIRFLGLSNEGRYWRMGIEHPRQPDEYAAVLELPEGYSITTVGDYLDFVMVKGKRYPMLVDPHTGEKPANSIAGVTVIAKKSSLSYAVASAFFVMGPEKGHALVESLKNEGVEAVCIEETSPDKLSLSVSEGVQQYLKDIRI